MLSILLTLVHVVVAVFLVLVVLLQTGKRADLAGAFGGGGSQTAFGSRGAATLLTKSTTAAAVLFMLTSLGLSLLSARGSSSGTALDAVAPETETSLPATPPPLQGTPDGLGQSPAPPLDPAGQSAPEEPGDSAP